MLHATTSVKPTPEFNVLVDFDIEALCKNRCMSSSSVIVMHMFTSGLKKRQAVRANRREILEARELAQRLRSVEVNGGEL